MPNPLPNSFSDEDALRHRVKLLRDNGLHAQADALIKSNEKLLLIPRRTKEFLNRFVTQNPAMLEVKESIAKLARVNEPVLIEGPTGTGKELLAHALHGDKGDNNFIDINCAGLPEHLLESELFGHMKGAFTGASETYAGLIKSAGDGTVFLDEIGELPLSVQAKLLRVLQERVVRKVGSHRSEAISCRFVAATHRNLTEMVKSGTFREDLFYRLNTFHLKLLPLIERSVDVPLILDYVADVYERENNITVKRFPRNYPVRLSSEVIGGNVRSLQQIVKRFYVLGILPDTIK